jgi:RNA polymerase sigma factor (sigma-70 family)
MDKSAIAELARTASAGDAEALAKLIEELEPLVVRTTRLIVGPGSQAAEDAAQDALVDLARKVSSLRDPEAVVAWCARIATRRALRAARFERARRLREVRAHSDVRGAEMDGRRAALGSAFDALPARQRAVAVLRLYLGLSEAETADALGISPGGVKSQLHEARRRLTASLAGDGYAPGVHEPSPTKGAS